MADLRFVDKHPLPDKELADRLASRVIRDERSGCWLWQGAIKRGGYGHISVDYKMKLVHRVAWELTNGPIEEGLEIDHLCKVRNCLNPAHLEPVTKAENVRRGNPEYAPATKVNREAINQVYINMLKRVKELGEIRYDNEKEK